MLLALRLLLDLGDSLNEGRHFRPSLEGDVVLHHDGLLGDLLPLRQADDDALVEVILIVQVGSHLNQVLEEGGQVGEVLG